VRIDVKAFVRRLRAGIEWFACFRARKL